MPKKSAPKKPIKKVAKTTKSPEETTAPVTSKSAIESLPTPTIDPQPAVSVEPTVPTTANPVESSPASSQASVTPASPVTTPPVSPTTSTDVPTVATVPDQTTNIPTESLSTPIGSSPLPQATPLGEPAADITAVSDDFEPEHKGSMMKIFLIFLTALIVGGGAVAGFMYFSQSKQSSDEKKMVAPTQAPVISIEEPVASDSAEPVNVAELSVQILNGSGTAGEAARVRDLLEEAGFETFSLGNADSYDFTDTEVQIKEELGSIIYEQVKEALSIYSVVEKDPLPKSSDYDIVIFVGKQK